MESQDALQLDQAESQSSIIEMGNPEEWAGFNRHLGSRPELGLGNDNLGNNLLSRRTQFFWICSVMSQSTNS